MIAIVYCSEYMVALCCVFVGGLLVHSHIECENNLKI